MKENLLNESINLKILSSILKKGYYLVKTKYSSSDQAIFRVITNFKYKNLNKKKGYSIDIFDQLGSKIIKEIYSFVKKQFNRNEWIKQYIFLPKILKVEVLCSTYNNLDSKIPTRAMLWHRDADDIFGHIKMIIPISKINKNNGMFSCLSRIHCHRLQYLRDKKFIKSLKNKNKYYKADQSRLSDPTIRKHFSKDIFDFKSAGDDILFIDTNNCYHKGGQVLKKHSKRYMIIVTIGSITHSFNSYFSEKRFNFIKMIAKSMKIYKKITLNIEMIFKEKIINL
ncbi:hypothetical protein N9N31_02840 [Candidatus Pelagibacter bacterium]|nr:hypothetical protein [Candidatus Pelagibacter bacterium]MDA8835242.1 hypothetical protein [Candidatus Pelagibacter bacterium]